MIERESCSLMVDIGIVAPDAATLPCLVEIDDPAQAKLNLVAMWFARYYQREEKLSHTSLQKNISAICLLRDYYILVCKSRPMAEGDWGPFISEFLFAVDNGTCLGWPTATNERYHEVRVAVKNFIKFCHDIKPHPTSKQDVDLISACIESERVEKQLVSSRLYDTYSRAKKKARGKRRHGPAINGKPFPPSLLKDLISETRNCRDKLIWSILAFGSPRVSELANLFLEDMVPVDGELRVYLRHPKEYRMKWVTLSGKVEQGTRAQYLRAVYDRLPRPAHGGLNTRAGWKTIAFDDEKKHEAALQWLHEAGAHLLELYRSYMNNMRTQVKNRNHPYAFVAGNGEPLKIRDIQSAFRAACKRVEKKRGVNLKGYGVHSLRHYYGFYCVDVLNLPLELVQKYMHHCWESSTAVYARRTVAAARKHLKHAHDAQQATAITELDGEVLSEEERAAICNEFKKHPQYFASELLDRKVSTRRGDEAGTPQGGSLDPFIHRTRKSRGFPRIH